MTILEFKNTVHAYSFHIISLCYFLYTGPAGAQSFEHPGGLHSQSQLETARMLISTGDSIRTGAYNLLLEQAEQGLEKLPDPPADFNVPGYYDDAGGHREMMGRLSTDAWVAYSCAVAYQLTPGPERVQYAEKAAEILDAWATVNKKTSNYDGDLAMADAGAGFVFAAELLSDYEGWKETEKTAFSTWLVDVYLKSCLIVSERPNNWGDWGILGCIATHYYLDDAKALDADILYIRKKIDESIASDGHLPHETKRGKRGIWYSYFALAPLTAACQIALNASGTDLFHFRGTDGAGIEQALDYLLRYCEKPETWPHYSEADLNMPQPHAYPGNLFEAMLGIYGKKKYGNWILHARPIMVYGHHYAWNLPTLLQPAGL